MREHGRDELARSETHRLLPSGKREDEARADRARRRTREHRAWSDLIPGEPPECLAEAIEVLVEEIGERFEGLIAWRDAGSAGEDDRVRFVVFEDIANDTTDPLRLIR